MPIILVTLFFTLVEALPQPHNVQGYVFNNGTTTGVGGIPVLINETVTGDSTLTRTLSIPPFFPFLGSYSATINGSDNDIIIATAWNKTQYGRASTTLAPTTTYLNITLNLTRPSETNVTIITPANNSLKNTSDSFNVTAKIAIIGGQDGTSCNTTISFSNSLVMNISAEETFTHILGNMPLGTSITTTWNVTGIREGSSNITVKAECSSDGENFDNENIKTASNITVEDTTLPVVNLQLPNNNSWSKVNNLTLKYNATDISGIKNCSLYFDNTLNITNTNVITYTSQNFTINNTSEGNHTWFVSCYDNSSNYNQGSSSKWLIKVDITLPIVNLVSPENNSVRENNTILFQYNVTDNFDVDNCSLIINGIVYQTNSTITKNITQNFTKTLQGGIYNWSVNCSDSAGNVRDSEVRFLNITDPDLTLTSLDIVFSNDNPIETENVTINATISNIGNENATNVVVQFFENDPSYGIQINGNKIVNVSAGSNVTVSNYWIAKTGTYNIFVIMDPPLATNGSIAELNESNNQANKTISIPAYIVYYGEVSADIILDSASNLSVFVWLNESNVAGNIFVADSDSSINWNNLQALSRNLSNELNMNDFEEVDTALNMTNLSDSINTTFTYNNAPKNTTNFTVYGYGIDNVSITNSTNTANFVTGILWDYSDANNGGYNGTQDLVFITKINQDKQGRYGIYDYEIKVPANLRRYIIPNNQNTVTFYIELK